MNYSIHIIISHRASFTPRVSGAVALNIRNFLLHSRAASRSIVYGKQQEDTYPDISYCGIRIPKLRLGSRAASFGHRVAARIPDSASAWVQVHNRPAVFNIIARKLKQARLCLYLHHDPFIIKGLETTAQRLNLLSRASAVICVSGYVRERFLDGIETMHEKVHVIYNGIDMQGMAPPSDNAARTIVFAGRLIPEKGALELALALGRVLPEHPEWSAVFVGSSQHAASGTTSGYQHDVMKAVEPVRKQIEFTGHVSNAEVQKRFRNARIAVIPSICEEGLGRVPMEAMANGCAIVSSDRGGQREVTDGNALIVDPESHVDIARALEKLVNDPALLAAQRLRCFESVRSRLDIRQLSRQLDDLRDSIMAGDRQ